MKKVKESIDPFALDQLAIMQYLVHGANLEHNFRSPFRIDRGPGCWLSEFNGKLYYHDPKDPIHNGKNIVDLWMIVHNVSYQKALQDMQRFSGAVKRPERIRYKKPTITKFDFKYREWEKYDEEYWLEYGLTILDLEPDLKPIAYYDYISSKFKGKVRVVSRPSMPLYVYKFESGNTKVYGPRSNPKFFSQCTAEDLYLYKKDSKTLFVTSSGKDAKVVFKETPYDVAAQNGEMYGLSNALLELSKGYDHVIISMDGDNTGWMYNRKLAQSLSHSIPGTVSILDLPYELKDYARAKKILKEEFHSRILKLINERRCLFPSHYSGGI